MIDEDDKIEYYWSLKPSHFPTLGRMELLQHTRERMRQDLTLELLPRDPSDSRRMLLVFKGVLELRFIPGGWSLVPVYLEITSISQRQWEAVPYKVSDNEDLDFSFFCKDFTVAIEGAA